jgi:hypothetical protein
VNWRELANSLHSSRNTIIVKVAEQRTAVSSPAALGAAQRNHFVSALLLVCTQLQDLRPTVAVQPRGGSPQTHQEGSSTLELLGFGDFEALA